MMTPQRSTACTNQPAERHGGVLRPPILGQLDRYNRDVCRFAASVPAPLLALLILATAQRGLAQTIDAGAAAPHQHDHGAHEVLFPAREASGTAWQPDVTAAYGTVKTWGSWTAMLHGLADLQFLYEPGDIHRTGGFATSQLGSVNWGMLQARRQSGGGRAGLSVMGSLELWTVPGCGALNLLATGEMCEGDSIHDRQHPHDLLMELAADYDRPLGRGLRWQIYGGLAGEPALGPPGFPHRLSALPNPMAPIGHHWMDSTHVVFGLVTSGVYGGRWKAEASIFNGREPDADRADLDLGALDSYSGRLTILPRPGIAVQVSAARLHEAEAEFPPQPRSDVDRFTASAIYHRPAGERGIWATTIAYGVNAGSEVIEGAVVELTTHAGMLETSVTLDERHVWFGRGEVVGKPAHDLHAHQYRDRVFVVGKLQAGYVRVLGSWKGLTLGIGGTVSTSLLPPELAPRYEGRVAPGFGMFVTLRPASHRN
jgi:hypothetical protein